MSDSNFNEYDYNNGIPPRDGMVWNPGDQEYAGHWGWKTDGANIPPGQGNTLPSLIVWPEKPDVTDWYIPGEKPFNPTTGDGWVPAIDGYGELLPAGVPAVIQTAINQVKTAPLKGSITASDIWKLTPPPGYPGGNYVVDPVFIYFPVQALTDSNISAMASAPEKMPLHTRILDDVHDGVQFISAVSAGGSPYNLPVIKATARGSYYTIGRLPGMLSSNTFEFYANPPPPRADSWFVSNETKAGGGVREAGFTAGASTSDC
ncbi:MAG: colicin-like bacteriocin tRNase domain-containing protein, partial [Gibbsiella quercinecans]|uniref:colicin-like bacteriocin tRNase domain-containing protein n=1 Tax=Gibbsiella quercinecans TaxID=929813 RepID=UPI003F33BE3B